MVNSEKFFIINEEIKLEAEYFQSSAEKDLMVLLIHPHPQFLGA